MNIVIMCGMSAAFSALFGTPMAAAFFSMEVVSVALHTAAHQGKKRIPMRPEAFLMKIVYSKYKTEYLNRITH